MLCYIIFGFFSFLGLVDTIKFILFKLFKFTKNETIKLNSDNIEYFLRTLSYQNLWCEKIQKPNLVIEKTDDNDTKKILHIFSKNHSHLNNFNK